MPDLTPHKRHVHRRGGESVEEKAASEIRGLFALCVLCASAVNRFRQEPLRGIGNDYENALNFIF
jgi:hypothetical protein